MFDKKLKGILNKDALIISRILNVSCLSISCYHGKIPLYIDEICNTIRGFIDVIKLGAKELAILLATYMRTLFPSPNSKLTLYDNFMKL